MKEFLPILEGLAASLGTTVEHLWGILLRQAPISAVTDLVQYGLIMWAIIFWIKMTRTMKVKIDSRDAEDENWIWIIAGWFVIAVFIFASFFSFPMTVAKIVNPEYWATMEILDKLNPKQN